MRQGWYGERHRHYLAAKGIKTKYYSNKYYAYTPTYTGADLPLIGADAAGTVGASTVSVIPVVVPLGLAYLLASAAKRHKDKTGHWYLKTKDCDIKLKHGDKPDWEFDGGSLAQGMKVELEHTDNELVAKQIAKAHLAEDSQYYDKLAKIESTAPGKVDEVQGIPIKAESIEPNQIYPISIDDLKKSFNRMKKEDLEGIQSIEFKKPVGEQKDAYGQYIRSKKKVYVFAQPFEKGKVDGDDPKAVRKHVIEYVLPHEIGHHKALDRSKLYDKKLEMAEARADANVIGMAPNDKAVKMLVNARQ